MSSIADVLEGRARWCVVEGDCRDVMRGIHYGSIVLITDPPYGVDLGESGSGRGRGAGHGLAHRPYSGFVDTYEHFVGEVVPRLNAALDLSKRGLVWTGPHIHEQRKPDAIGGVYCPASPARTSWGFKSFLPALLYGTAPELNKGAQPTVLVSSETPDRDGNDHPVPKPLGFMTWSVRLASRDGDIILDPFAGSGTTGVAALRLGGRAILIERDPKYAALARERMQAEEAGSTLQAQRAGQVALFGK